LEKRKHEEVEEEGQMERGHTEGVIAGESRGELRRDCILQ
jgi:hypothetical protein